MTGITVVGLVVNERDRQVLASIASRSQWNVVFADTCEEARTALDLLQAPVILCDRDLPDREWQEVIEILASSPHRASIILISKFVDQYLWDEVVRRGGYEVLTKPLRENDVMRAVKLAWNYWRSHEPVTDLRPQGRVTDRG